MVNGLRGNLKVLAIMAPAALLLVLAINARPAWAQNSGYSGGDRSGGAYTGGKYSGRTYGTKGGGSSPFASGRGAVGGGIPRPVWRTTPSAPAPWRNTPSPGALPGKTLSPMVKDYTSYSGYYGSYGIVTPSTDVPKAEEEPTDGDAPSTDEAKPKGASTK